MTVTGDTGTPVALAPGAPSSMRNMNADVAVTLTGAERDYNVSVVGPGRWQRDVADHLLSLTGPARRSTTRATAPTP